MRRLLFTMITSANAWGVCSSALAATPVPANESTPPIIRSILGDGFALNKEALDSNELWINHHTRRVSLQVAATAEESQPLSFRYQLQGKDRTWQHPGRMRLHVHVSCEEPANSMHYYHVISGESKGWNGTPETAPLTPHRIDLELPPGARTVQLFFDSGAPNSEQDLRILGMHVMSGLQIHHVSGGGASHAQSEKIVFGEHLEPFTLSQGAAFNNLRQRNSKITRTMLDSAGKERIIVEDSNVENAGGWMTRGPIPLPPDTRSLTLEWEHAYSTGRAGWTSVVYSNLPAGVYKLHLQTINEKGLPASGERVMTVTISPPFHETVWFWIVVAFLCACLSGAAAWLATRTRWMKQVHRLEKEQMVDRERRRIARDLHDHLGADLTQLAMLSDLLQTRIPSNEEMQGQLDQLFELAQGMTRQVDEIVWAVNPQNDTLQDFVSYLTAYMQQYLASAGIQCRLNLPDTLPSVELPSGKRHHLFMLAKEALHNIVKHAGATEAILELTTSGKQFCILIEDNGRGMPANMPQGDGLENMRTRAVQAGGSFETESLPGKGTKIRIRIPLSNLPAQS